MATSSSRIYKNDIGTIFRFDIGTSAAGAKLMMAYVRKPNGNVMEWPCTLDPEDNNKIRYVSKAGDLDEVGMYLVQTKVTQQTWGPLRGDTDEFNVLDDFTN